MSAARPRSRSGENPRRKEAVMGRMTQSRRSRLPSGRAAEDTRAAPELPRVRQFMTRIPYTIPSDATLRAAADRMVEYNVRHLPVLDKGTVIGMLSDRDVKLVSGLDEADLNNMRVSDACHGVPYIVARDAPLREVASTMAKKRYGSAIVTEHGRVVGIFTTVDACRALATLIDTPR
jgi:acetoin utilization protein AcuB